MNFNNAVAFLLSTASTVQAGQSGLRSLSAIGGDFSQGFNSCTGAKCGVWGDPHIDTCDGLIYDCQATGIYTLMKNHAFNVQANFVDVSASDREHIIENDMDLPLGASMTNDVMIDFLLDDSPIFQFGFGDLSNHDGTFPAEEGCVINHSYKPANMPGTSKERVGNVEQCRKRCEDTQGCTGFSYWADSWCHVVNDSSSLIESKPNWSRAVSGTLDSDCGTHEPDMSLLEGEERMKHGYIGEQCPLLMWVDGVMMDLSNVEKTMFLYGDENSDTNIELIGGRKIEFQFKMPRGDIAAIRLKAEGKGPGELWSCHWDFWICLPGSDQIEFETGTTGLLGSPDGDPMNDWMDTGGTVLEMTNFTLPEAHNDSMAYCVDNWCVPQNETMMSFHGNTDYGDHKCANETHRDFIVTDPSCVLSAEKIEEVCKGMPPVAYYACQLDCCMGGCDQLPDVIPDLDRPGVPTEAPAGDPEGECVLVNTPDAVCPTATGPVVTLLQTTGNEPLPADAPVFHSIYQDPDPDDNGDTTVHFKVNNPFDSAADVYVKHDENVLTTFTTSVCPAFEIEASGCNKDEIIEVACKEYPGVAPFALVNVYFASVGINSDSNAEIDQCCEPEDYEPSVGIVEYTFKIECVCPESTTQ